MPGTDSLTMAGFAGVVSGIASLNPVGIIHSPSWRAATTKGTNAALWWWCNVDLQAKHQLGDYAVDNRRLDIWVMASCETDKGDDKEANNTQV